MICKYFLSAFLVVIIGMLGIVGVFNYCIDPARLFDSSHSIEQEMALLLKNHTVSGIANFDDRLLQKYRLADLPAATKVDFLIIGSSRSMYISTSLMHEKVLNVSVSVASIEDYISILKMATEKIHPKVIILGVDRNRPINPIF
ncbi:MAG: hypothetical protein A3E85_00505 [Gammaproteobacteria bacterium RIFCSPHIGHO2_12_FULL_45_12]|nr:MAG: hypothetical protein A3E85_00505 [Gammaproteobacteria bacterium RIFCSPHIGHO2_12_FULL_45_12]